MSLMDQGLKLAARTNKPGLCGIFLGRATEEATTEALLIAAERKNHNVTGHILNLAAFESAGGSVSLSDGNAWNRVNALAAQDTILGQQIDGYNNRSTRQPV